MNKKACIVEFLKGMGRWWPHVAVALIVPGGLVLAILLWIYQHRHSASDSEANDNHGDSGHSVGGAA